MTDEFKPDGPSRLATGADFVAAMTQANEFLIERDKRIAELEAALRGIINHWNEFGEMMGVKDDYGLDERMDAAERLLK